MLWQGPEVAVDNGLRDRRTVPESEDLVRQGDDRAGVVVAVRPDGGGREAARDNIGVEQDTPVLWWEFEELQRCQPSDLQWVGERLGVGGSFPEPKLS